MNAFLIIVNLIILVSAAVTLYGQSKIDLKASYSYWSLIYAAILDVWLISAQYTSFDYIIFIAAFTVLNIMSGVGGLTDTRIILNRSFFTSMVSYSSIASVTLTLIPLPLGKTRVVGVFTTQKSKNLSLIFPQPVEEIIAYLATRLPQNTQVDVIHPE